MSNSSSNKRTAEAASLANDDVAQECENTTSTPVMPINIISDLILPFIHDRRTWNSVCSANKELYDAGTRMTPPWPETKFRLGQSVNFSLTFSPCGSFLACGAHSSPYLVHICNRRGTQTYLEGYISPVLYLSFSNDGNYLASVGANDTSIHLLPTNSTRLPQQAYQRLLEHTQCVNCLDFTPDDSNILAYGDRGAIKLWNVEQEVCIYNFNHTRGSIRSMGFSDRVQGYKCIFSTYNGSLIRTCWDDLSGIENDIVDLPGLGGTCFLSFVSLF